MTTPSFDLLIIGRQKVAAAAGPSPTQQALNKARIRLVQQVYNNRRLVYRNRIETNRQKLVLSTIESAHNREQAAQRLHRHHVLTDLKRKNSTVDSCLTLLPSYKPIDLTEPKDFYRFGVRVQSATPHLRSRTPGIRSDLTRQTNGSTSLRAKSASTISRPFTAPLQTFFHEETESDDDEAVPFSISRATSAKYSTDRLTSAATNSTISQQSSDLPFDNLNLTSVITNAPSTSNHRITWPVKIKVFALQDEDEARQQFLAWRAEQRKTKPRRVSKEFYDIDLERKYQESIRRRKEIESFVTPELIEEHQLNDPVFAKRYRQLKLAIRAGKIPTYDPSDREIHITMNKSKIERTRTALITAKQTKIKNFYRNQQQLIDAQLSKRIDTFLKRLAKLKQEQEQEEKEEVY